MVLKDILVHAIDGTIQTEDAGDRERWRDLWQAALALNGP